LKAELEQELSRLGRERRQREDRIYLDAGVRFVDEHTIKANVGWLVRRNARRMHAAAAAFDQLAAQRGWSASDVVGAVVAMAQTSLDYRIPPDRIGDWETLGVLPPPLAFVRGWGDCDTKSALVGAILANWRSMRVLGVNIPKHYLLAVPRLPGPGDAYLEYGGVKFVLIEAAGPGWLPPGQVGETTREYMQAGGRFTLEPLWEGT
jgi:hypothetical protein